MLFPQSTLLGTNVKFTDLGQQTSTLVLVFVLNVLQKASFLPLKKGDIKIDIREVWGCEEAAQGWLVTGHRPWDRPAWCGHAWAASAAVPVQHPAPHPSGSWHLQSVSGWAAELPTCCDEPQHDSHRPSGSPTWRAEQVLVLPYASWH